MIEILTYQGDARELVEFTTAAWKASASGLPHAPRWSETNLEWQLLRNPSASPEFRVAAYDGGALVGTLFAEEFDFWMQGERTRGTLASWLTVAPEYRRRGVAGKLAEELRQRHRERGARFCIGFGLLGSGGARFWSRQPDTLLPGKTGFWVRVLDRSEVSSWSMSLRDRLGVHLLRLWAGPVESPGEVSSLRNYRDSDLDSCLALCNRPATAADLGLVWTRERLGHQLRFGDAVRTHLLTRDDRVAGIVSYYLLAFTGRTERRMAIFDIVELEDSAGAGDGKRLLYRALHEALDAGASSALVLRQPSMPKRALFASGFVPLPPDFEWILTLAAEPERMRSIHRIHALWR